MVLLWIIHSKSCCSPFVPHYVGLPSSHCGLELFPCISELSGHVLGSQSSDLYTSGVFYKAINTTQMTDGSGFLSSITIMTFLLSSDSILKIDKHKV